MTTTSIVLVRHTDVHNPQGVFYGRLPRFGLSALGREQAENTARHLADLPLTAVYTSPLLRATQTARIITSHHRGMPLRKSRLLLEVKTSWQGTSFDGIGRHINLYEPRRSPNDETIDDVFARMERLLRRLLRQHRGQTIVCVSHADPIMILRVGVLGQELSLGSIRGSDYPGKGSITRLDFPPGCERPLVSYVDINQEVRVPATAPA